MSWKTIKELFLNEKIFDLDGITISTIGWDNDKHNNALFFRLLQSIIKYEKQLLTKRTDI